MGNLSRPIAALIDRLTFHCGPGQILDGFTFEPQPASHVGGQKDLPTIAFKLPGPSESYAGWSVVNTITVALVVSTKRQTANALVEHLNAVEKVLDAIDTDGDGEVNLGLAYQAAGEKPVPTLRVPITVRAGGQYALDLSINTELTLMLEARPAGRGSRR